MIAAIIAMPALGVQITTVFEGTIDGRLDNVAFTNQSFVVTAIGDTDNLVSFDAGPDGSGFDLPIDSVTISLPGLNGGTTLDVTSTTFVSVNNGNGSIGFTDENFFSGVFVSDPTFDTYGLSTSLSPVTSSGVSNDFPIFETDGGDFIFGAGTPSLTFSATLIPEPGSLALIGLGGLLIVRRKR
ncbi:MAG: PEP-CTERM sorting domain-containing protein [Planctomycetota bacterium]